MNSTQLVINGESGDKRDYMFVGNKILSQVHSPILKNAQSVEISGVSMAQQLGYWACLGVSHSYHSAGACDRR